MPPSASASLAASGSSINGSNVHSGRNTNSSSSNGSRSSSSSGSSSNIHQDYVARIRYSNALPPPAIPPKLVDIPNPCFTNGIYTDAAYASRIAREKPVNIEIDAELGMHLDLVGLPGVFEGDESCTLDPRDRALLKPFASLGLAKPGDPAVSFLRRTEYISSQANKKSAQASMFHTKRTPSALDRFKRGEKRAAGGVDGPSPGDPASPAVIRRKIDTSFAVAQDYLANPRKIKHPRNKAAKLVDSFPILPDLEAFPDSGAYVTLKFTNNPVKASRTYDTRLLNGLFKPIEITAAEEERFNEAMEFHQRDPATYPKPDPVLKYDFYLNKTPSDAAKFRAKFDLNNPDYDDESLYPQRTVMTSDDGTTEEKGCFEFARLRSYETVKELELDHNTKYSHDVLLAFNKGDDIISQKALWYYPVMQRSVIRPQRQRGEQEEEDLGDRLVDTLEVTIEDPTDDMRSHMLRYKERPFGFDEIEEDVEEEEAATQDHDRRDSDAEDEERRSHSDHDHDDDREGGHTSDQSAEGEPEVVDEETVSSDENSRGRERPHDDDSDDERAHTKNSMELDD